MIVNCPVCGKEYDVLYPDKWTYKRRRTGEHMFYLCSWSCLRKFDEAKESAKQVKHGTITLEQKKKAVDIALAGGNPLTFLAECGSANPGNMWWTIKQNLKEVDPEKYEKLPKRLNTSEKAVPGIPIDRIEAPAMPQKAETPEEPEVTLADAMNGMKDAADEFFGTCKEMGLTLEKAKKDATPVVHDGMTIREIEGVFGRYRRSDVNGATYIDFECDDGLDILSLTVNQWIQFREEQEKAFAILGVII